MVKLASPDADDSVGALTSRLAALEERVAQLLAGGVSTLPPAPVNPGSGRAKIGGRASGTGDTTAPTPAPASSPPPSAAAPTEPPAPQPQQEPKAPVAPVADTPPAESAEPSASDPAQAWPQIVDGLRALAKAIFRPATVDSVENNVVTVRIPANTPMDKAQQQLPALTDELRRKCGAKYSVTLVKDDTNAVERPEEGKTRTIVDEVAEDDYSPVDPADILPGEAHDDHAVGLLSDMFPRGKVEQAPAKKPKK